MLIGHQQSSVSGRADRSVEDVAGPMSSGDRTAVTEASAWSCAMRRQRLGSCSSSLRRRRHRRNGGIPRPVRTRETHRASLRTPPADCAQRDPRSHAACGAPRRHTECHRKVPALIEARGCRCGVLQSANLWDDRSLCSPEPSPQCRAQRAQSANSLAKIGAPVHGFEPATHSGLVTSWNDRSSNSQRVGYGCELEHCTTQSHMRKEPVHEEGTVCRDLDHCARGHDRGSHVAEPDGDRCGRWG